MRTADALTHYGTQAALARAIGISQPSVATWGEVVPLASAYALEIATDGALRLDRSMYPQLARAIEAAAGKAA